MIQFKFQNSSKYIFISIFFVLFFAYCNSISYNQENCKYVTLWDNGDTFDVFYFRNGSIDSLWFIYDSGYLYSKQELLNGKTHGFITYYYSSRTVKLQSSYTKNYLDGIAKEYDEEGNLRKQYLYCYPSIECGNWYYFNAVGDTIMIEKYDTGDLIETIVLADTTASIFQVDLRRRENLLSRLQNDILEKVSFKE